MFFPVVGCLAVNNGSQGECPKLEEIIVDPDNEYFRSYDGDMYTKDMKTLVRVPCLLDNYNIPSCVTRIVRKALHSCTRLSSIKIPDSVNEIGWDAFSNCTSLISVEIPYGVTKIEEGVFADRQVKNLWLSLQKYKIDLEENKDFDVELFNEMYDSKAKLIRILVNSALKQ